MGFVGAGVGSVNLGTDGAGVTGKDEAGFLSMLKPLGAWPFFNDSRSDSNVLTEDW